MNILKNSSFIFAATGHLFDPKRTNTMAKNQWTNKMLLEALKGTEAERALAMRHILHNAEWRNFVYQYVLKDKGSKEDAEDTFQEALILLDKKVRTELFEEKSELKTFFFGIAKWYWLGRKRKDKKHLYEPFEPQHSNEAEESVEVKVIREEQKKYMRQALEKMGERCKKVLEYYQLSYSMEEIAEALQLSSPAIAKKEAYRCRMKLRDFLLANPDWKNLVT